MLRATAQLVRTRTGSPAVTVRGEKVRRRSLIVAAAVLVLLVLLALVATRFRLSALQDPGAVETYLASAAKRWFVERGARSVKLPVVVDDADSIGRGSVVYGASCSFCHGIEGRRPIDVGLWMYPRAPEMNAWLVGQWSNVELFWIIKNGIRMTGMPGFEQIHSDEEIVDLVHYLRSLSQPSEE